MKKMILILIFICSFSFSCKKESKNYLVNINKEITEDSPLLIDIDDDGEVDITFQFVNSPYSNSGSMWSYCRVFTNTKTYVAANTVTDTIARYNEVGLYGRKFFYTYTYYENDTNIGKPNYHVSNETYMCADKLSQNINLQDIKEWICDSTINIDFGTIPKLTVFKQEKFGWVDDVGSGSNSHVYGLWKTEGLGVLGVKCESSKFTYYCTFEISEKKQDRLFSISVLYYQYYKVKK
jgi:hypothetical protein